MSRERRRRALELFDQVCDLSASERAAWLDEQCAGDVLLRTLVERMLKQDDANDVDLAPGDGAALIAAQLMADAPEEPPKRIGRYQIIREIGRGGMGVVYEAQQDEPRRRVAVKVIREGVASREVVLRFQRESQLLARLHHPGIAHVYESGIDLVDGVKRPYYAMEYIDGLPLDRHADKHDLDTRQRVELVARVCDAVLHAHQKGILHRDLKTANVLVATAEQQTGTPPDGSFAIDAIGQPKVVDFGIARLADDEDGVTQHTHVGQIMGSLACMSPEQLSGDRDRVDTRSDVYAIGVMLYRLLARRMPHALTGMSIPEAARVVAEQEPPTLGSIDRTLRGDLSVIAAKALERDVDRRYDSVAPLCEDLRRALRDEPITARPDSQWYRIYKFARRNRSTVTLALAIVLLLIGSTIVSSWFALRATAARNVAEQTARRADRAAYRAAISAASAAIREGDARLAQEFLREAPPALRGWEWRHLRYEVGRSILSGSRSVRWDSETADYLYAACWLSPDGSVLHAPTGYGNMRAFESFDAASLQLLGHWVAGPNDRCVGVVGDGKRVLLSDPYSGELRMCDLLTGEEKGRLAPHAPNLGLCESFDPLPANLEAITRTPGAGALGRFRFMGSLNPTGDAWIPWRGVSSSTVPLGTDVRPVVFGRQGEGVSHACFSADGQQLAMTTLDRRVKLYEASSGRLLWERAEVHQDAPMSIAFSPDGAMLATGGQDRVIKFWDFATGALIGKLIGHEETIVALAFERNGETLYSADAIKVHKWRVRDAVEPGVVIRHSSFVHTIRLSRDGSMLVSYVAPTNAFQAPTREIKIVDLRSERASGALELPQEATAIMDAAFLDTTRLAVLTEGKAHEAKEPPTLYLSIYEAPAGIPLQTLTLGPISHGTLEVGNGIATIWGQPPTEIDLTTLNVRTTKKAKSLPQLRAHPTIDWIAANGDVIHAYGALESAARCYVVNRTNTRAYIGTTNGYLHMLDLESGDHLAAIETSGEALRSLALLPDGSRVIGGSADTTIRIWDTNTLDLVAVLRGHKDVVTGFAVSPDGAVLYSASDDYTVRVWKTKQ